MLALSTAEGQGAAFIFCRTVTESRTSNAMQAAIAFSDDSRSPAVRGFLHSPANANGDALILTHGAGSNCTAPLLVALSETFAAHGYVILRCDLPFPQDRPTAPPFPPNPDPDPPA